MTWTSIRRGLIALFILLGVGGLNLALAQTGTTSVRGTVTDKSGAAIVGVNVSIRNAEAAVERTTQTGPSGEYEFLALPPGTYTLRFEKDNFQKHEQSKLQLLVNLPATVDVVLQVGSSTQTVEVSAQAEALNTTDASLGNAFNENQVKQLPLEGRNVPDLLSLQPGVAYPNSRTDIPAFDTRKGAVNGARSDQSNVTVDGIPANDEGGDAFTSVLPVTLDSVQEFRVSTTNYNADQGGTSGAQVSMVTKSGTNDFHGSAYEYLRNTYTSANDEIIKNAQIQSCLDAGTPLSDGSCNKAPKLIRNIFGGSIGGPIKKDRLFIFTNYEGTRRAEATSQTGSVPSLAMRDGILQYECDDPSACPGGPVAGLSGKTYNVQPGNFGMSPAQLKGIDPLGIGSNAAMLTYLNSFPTPNSTNCPTSDGLNYVCYNFSAPISEVQNLYIAKMDYNITTDGKQHISVMGALRNDNFAEQPYLPGQNPEHDFVTYNKGIVVNYNAVLRPNLINNFRYGFIRESVGDIGNSNQPWIYIRGLNDPTGAITYSYSFQRPINTFADDVSWIKGRHTWSFGVSLSYIRTPSDSTLTSFSDGFANASWTDTAGYAGKSGSPLNPSNYCPTGPASCLPAVNSDFAGSYDYPLTALLGMVTEVDARYNYTKDGTALPSGADLKRRYGIDGYEFYVQDSWKVKPTLTLTLGVRYNLYSPPWETNGVQVSPTVNMGNWFLGRASAGENMIPSNQDPSVSFALSGPANNKPNYYDWDPKNIGPRVAFAWAPRGHTGVLGSALGEGKTSVRGGFSVIYDRFGQGIADDFSQFGSFGLSTLLTNPAGFQNAVTAPRLTDLHTIPTTDNTGAPIYLPAPPSTFPQTFPSGTFSIGSTLDSGLKTPYAYTMDFSVSRELASGLTLEVAYVGRLGRRLLTQLDAATPLNLKDKSTGVDYFTAVSALAKLYRAGVTDANFNPSMLPANIQAYWKNIIQPAASGDAYALGSGGGCGNGPASTTSAVFAAFDLFCSNSLNETTGLFELDQFGIPGLSGNSYFPFGGQYTFYNPQFATNYMWKSMSTSSYNAMQVSLQHKMSHGVQFDFNYTLSRSIDLASDAERVGTIGGTGSQIINAWDPTQFRAQSDFNATHQFTADWIVELPFGRGREFGRNVNKVADAFIGGWQLSGLFRLTSAFPFSVFNGTNWATDWDLSGNGYMISPVKAGGAYNNVCASPGLVGQINAFADGCNAQSSFVEPLPGQSGTRNNLAGQGFFGVDLGLAKRWQMPWSEHHSLQLRWEVFNVTNSVRFDAQSINATLDSSGSSFGNYDRLSTNPRVMQFALRYEF